MLLVLCSYTDPWRHKADHIVHSQCNVCVEVKVVYYAVGMAEEEDGGLRARMTAEVVEAEIGVEGPPEDGGIDTV